LDDDFDFELDDGTDMGIGDDYGLDDNKTDDSDDDFGEFNNGDAQNVNEISEGKSTVIKQGLIIAIIGVLIILVTLTIVRAFTGDSKKQSSTTSQNSSSTTQSVQTSGTSYSNSTGWKEFTKTDNIIFNTDYVSSTFTVTSIKHYAKIVDSENNIEVKTELTGSLAGFIGTYTIEVPYSKGILLSSGNHFDVLVQVGDYNGKIVVGEIKY
jgi:hypothetical protein